MAWLLALPTTLLLFEELIPPTVMLGPLMVAAPVFAAVFCGPLGTLLLFAVTLICVTAAGWRNDQLGTTNFAVQLLAMILISTGAVGAAAVRARRERQLAQARWVTEVTQRTLLRPLPRRMGRLAFSSLYVAADDESAIGGDLFAAAGVDGGTRVLIGDAQGKGLAAIDAVSCVLGAFRRSTWHGTSLPDLADYLETSLSEELDELAGTPRPGSTQPRTEGSTREGFVTAAVVELPDQGDRISVLNRGHPPPLILRGSQVVRVEPAVPALPLGLGDLDDSPELVDGVTFLAGDTLLLYTDGVIEARDAQGTFYPLTERLPNWVGEEPDELLHALRDDLLHHTGGRLADDAAMVAVRRVT
ncbi:PP2C family protein-serine/threonine phosphatase [Streptomyces sp. NPDC092296]|uniref:PP2C family protein-serine/threonine phosphatase n=1 Tax=Streptomyces sp. NPDC092296 TaxID=3366012 RepID=UPI00381767B4